MISPAGPVSREAVSEIPELGVRNAIRKLLRAIKDYEGESCGECQINSQHPLLVAERELELRIGSVRSHWRSYVTMLMMAASDNA